jgi:hypothetical protein
VPQDFWGTEFLPWTEICSIIFQCRILIPYFIEIYLQVTNIRHGDKQRDITPPFYVYFIHWLRRTQNNISIIQFHFFNPINSWHWMLRVKLKRQVATMVDSQHNSLNVSLRNYHRNINNNSAIRKKKRVNVKLWTYLKCRMFIVLIVCCSTVSGLPKYFSVVVNMGRFINIRALQWQWQSLAWVFPASLYLTCVTTGQHLHTHVHNSVLLLCQERQSCLVYP